MIKFKRQGGGNSSSDPAQKPTTLSYGEPAISSDGTIYVGDGAGNIKSKVENATKSFRAGNGQWEFYGTYKLSGWVSKSGGYSQTVSVTCVNSGSIVMNSSARLSCPMTSQTDDYSQNEKKIEALGIINMGQCIPGDGTVTINCPEKPSMDMDIHWYVNLEEDRSEDPATLMALAQTMKFDNQNELYQVPVGYIFDWLPVEGSEVDLSSPGKVNAYFGYGTWKDLNSVLESDKEETYRWQRIA